MTASAMTKGTNTSAGPLTLYGKRFRGPLFRIERDEFVVQLDGLGQEQVTRGILAMERAVKAYSDGNVFPAGIAAGYAFFDPVRM